jgi:branched-chain amino acid transport system permease protein
LSGAIVSLGAIGLSFTMKMLRFANFSHSELLTWGAYSALVFMAFFSNFGGFFALNIGPFSFGPGLLLAMLCACVATSAIALLLHRFVFERLSRTAGNMTMIFASFGVALVLRHLVTLIWGSDLPFLSDRGRCHRPAPLYDPVAHRYRHARGGRKPRFGAGQLGGVLYGMTVQLRPELGFGLILPLFAAAILGGAGSLYGAVLGGMIVGLSENLSVMIIPTTYKPAVPFLLILAILYFRPQGIFGERS